MAKRKRARPFPDTVFSVRSGENDFNLFYESLNDMHAEGSVKDGDKVAVYELKDVKTIRFGQASLE